MLLFPEVLQCCESCSCFCYACSDIVVCVGVLCDDDPEVCDLLLYFDLWWLSCMCVNCAVLWVKVDWSGGVLSYEFAFACVEFEVVLCCCGLYELQYFLASVGCSREHHCVVRIGQVPEGSGLAMEPRLCLCAMLRELNLRIMHNGAVHYEEEVW